MTQRTLGPWTTLELTPDDPTWGAHDLFLYGTHVAHVMGSEHAATIVRACNSHDALIEALEAMLAHACVADADPDDKDAEDHEAERKARAALESAKPREAAE